VSGLTLRSSVFLVGVLSFRFYCFSEQVTIIVPNIISCINYLMCELILVQLRRAVQISLTFYRSTEHGSSSQCPSVTPVKPVYAVMINYVIERHGLVIDNSPFCFMWLVVFRTVITAGALRGLMSSLPNKEQFYQLPFPVQILLAVAVTLMLNPCPTRFDTVFIWRRCI
jgi:hypothetical protein